MSSHCEEDPQRKSDPRERRKPKKISRTSKRNNLTPSQSDGSALPLGTPSGSQLDLTNEDPEVQHISLSMSGVPATPQVSSFAENDISASESSRSVVSLDTPSGMRTPPFANVASQTDAVPAPLAILGDTVANSNREITDLAHERGVIHHSPQVDDVLESPKDDKEVEHPLPEQDSKAPNAITDLHTSGQSASAKPYRVDLLYRLICDGETAHGNRLRIMNYSDKPFAGVETHEDREKISVMDILDTKGGMWPESVPGRPKPLNQKREFFGTDQWQTPDKPFDLDKDFIATSSSPRAIRIMSPSIIMFMKEHVPYWHKELVEKELYLPDPFDLLAFTYPDIIAATGSVFPPAAGLEAADGAILDDLKIPESTAYDLGVLLKWYQPTYQKDIEPELEVQKRKMATYEKLWLLFQPGTTVSVKRDGYVDFYKVRAIRHTVRNGIEDQSHWLVSLWQLDFKGTNLSRRQKSEDVKIRKYPGEKEIVRLPVAPIKYTYPETESWKVFADRGRRYYRLNGQDFKFQSYQGALSDNKTLQYSGPVIIDPSVGSQRLAKPDGLGTVAKPVDDMEGPSDFREPNDNGGGPLYSGLNDLPSGEQTPFADEEMYLLFPRKISGFALGKRQWAQFDVEGLTGDDATSTDTDAFSDLVVESNKLDRLRALAAHTQGSRLEKMDFIEGKGQGKTILLYGPSGVGKSFTVECLAKDLQRPLLSLTVADIGTDQSTVERNLSGWLDLAQRWDAIILLDEADTYLERRAKGYSRNTLVAAFLRVLEYYPGLLFLTTNKPGWMDDAFTSRLHYCIDYPELTPDDRKAIWQKFLHKTWRLSEDQSFTVQNVKEVLSFVTSDTDVTALQLNGRDIRNAFQAAAKFAAYRTWKRVGKTADAASLMTVKITVDDFKVVTKNKDDFRKYLAKANDGKDETRRAAEEESLPP